MAGLLDVVVIGITLWAVLSLNSIEWDSKHIWWLMISVVTFSIYAEFSGLYRNRRGMLVQGGVKNILINWVVVLFVLAFINQFTRLIDPVYEGVFIFWAWIVPIEIVSWHLFVDNIMRWIRRSGGNSRRVVVAGANALGLEMKSVFDQEEWMGLNFIGFYDDRVESRDDLVGIEERGSLQQLINDAKKGEIDIVYITLGLKAEDRINYIITELSDTTVSVYYVPDFFGFDLLRSQWSSVGNIAVVSIYDSPFFGVDGILKRAFDIIFSIIILILIAIPMIIIGLSVKFTSPGPILFKQKRFGLGGEEINVWKFRSMSVMEDGDKVIQATKNDPRVTKLGAVLRRTSLDELPQFINVLQGRMSVVGPRPHAVAHNELYRKKIKGYMLRHKVKPGITGLAQVNGFRGETDTLDKMEGRVKYDLEYIRSWSLPLDIKIVFLTIFNGFFDKKAY
ncbi:MAG: undecaprenyl-phosphate glucose phosphotransferase [Methylococcales bacterium]|nr:undecaprenyl-phosphate glucose phosphotransferase [Methylococcales bacterium]